MIEWEDFLKESVARRVVEKLHERSARIQMRLLTERTESWEEQTARTMRAQGAYDELEAVIKEITSRILSKR